MTLSADQLNNVLESHVRSVIAGMDMDDLVAYAQEKMLESYYETSIIIDDNAIEYQVLYELMNEFDTDSDAVVDFMVDAGVNEEDAHKAIVEFMENN